MPWLVATALIHSLAVTETRGLFKSWTLLLAISAFSLSLLGTFLVRSGILVSVHSFASDPERGAFILAFIALVVGIALSLYAWRAPKLDSDAGFKPVSREAFLLLNNVLLVIAAVLIMFGTLAPLAYDAAGAGKPSIGPGVFEIGFMLPMLPLVFLIAVGMHCAWRATPWSRLQSRLMLPAILAPFVGVGLIWFVYGRPSLLTAVGATSAIWVFGASIREPLLVVLGKMRPIGRAAWGMHVAHAGVAVFVLGVAVVGAYGIESDQTMRAGQSVKVGDAEFVMRNVREVQGPNYQAIEAEIELRKSGRLIGIVAPQKRTYLVQKSPMTEAGIDARLSRDYFVALGDPLGDGSWSVRIQYKPMLRLIWLGTLIMALGGALAASDARYYSRRRRIEHAGGEPAGSPAQ